MRDWYRHRSAPVGVLVAGSFAILVTLVAGTLFYVGIVRHARGLPAYTAGIPRGRLDHPRSRRATYRVLLSGPVGRETPAGTPSTAHHWRVVAPAAPDDPLCAGAADDDLVAADDSGTERVSLPLPARLYRPAPARPVPPRVLATCPAAFPALTRPGGLEYLEEVVPREIPVDVLACSVRHDEGPTLADCDDGAPSRVYPLSSLDVSRAEARTGLHRVNGFATAFAVLCFLVGRVALWRFDHTRRRP